MTRDAAPNISLNEWELLTAPVTPVLLAAAALQPGEKVVEIGCGRGLMAMAAVGMVGTGGTVLGIDIATPLLEVARARASNRGLRQVRFIEANAERDDLPGAPFDVAIHRFGLTLATDLKATFARIRRQLRPGGRNVFAAWAASERNPLLPATLGAHFGRGRITDQDAFSMADTRRTISCLEQAGYIDVSCRTIELDHVVPRTAVMNDSLLDWMKIPLSERESVRREAATFLQPFASGDGVRVPLAFHIFGGVAR